MCREKRCGGFAQVIFQTSVTQLCPHRVLYTMFRSLALGKRFFTVNKSRLLIPYIDSVVLLTSENHHVSLLYIVGLCSTKRNFSTPSKSSCFFGNFLISRTFCQPFTSVPQFAHIVFIIIQQFRFTLDLFPQNPDTLWQQFQRFGSFLSYQLTFGAVCENQRPLTRKAIHVQLSCYSAW